MFRAALSFGVVMVFTSLFVHQSSAQNGDSYQRWNESMMAFAKADSEQMPPKGCVLFVGSSSIRMWATLADDMAPIPVINRGYGGSTIDDTVHFAGKIVFPYQPSAIVFYAGDNDIAGGKSPEAVFEDFKRFETLVHKTLPGVPLYYIAIKPSPSRLKMLDNMKQANVLIERYCVAKPHCVFIDVVTPMLDSEGAPKKSLFLDDMLHMNADGYRLWTSLIKPRLEALGVK